MQTAIAFTALPPFSEDEVRKYVLKSPSTSCPLDPIPTTLLKTCLDELLPVLTRIINKCLSTGSVPSAFREALVIPLLKKSNAQIEFKNFCSISNLPFLSKISERVAIDHMSSYCETRNLNEPLQSAYCRGHSTETALLKVCNDILSIMDKGEVTTMAMLDLSAAFDTVHYTIFLNRLMEDFSICGTPLDWMVSYLSDRSQQAVINGTRSDSVSLSTGFPQGGGAGPWAYSRYTQPVSRIIQLLTILYHFFADDTQLYKSFKPSSIEQQTAAINSIELCIKRVSEWMFTNRLKLNMDKTEFTIFGTHQQLSKVCCDSISVKKRNNLFTPSCSQSKESFLTKSSK